MITVPKYNGGKGKKHKTFVFFHLKLITGLLAIGK